MIGTLIVLAVLYAVYVARRYFKMRRYYRSWRCAVLGHSLVLSDEEGNPICGWVSLGKNYPVTCTRCGEQFEPLTLTRDMLP